jgi:hypothetical protein
MRWCVLAEAEGLNPVWDVEASDFATEMAELYRFGRDLAALAKRTGKPVTRYQPEFDERYAETSEVFSLMLDAWQPEPAMAH